MGKILIVDDDQGTTQLLEMILSREGYEVKSVNNGYDTLPAALVTTQISFYCSIW